MTLLRGPAFLPETLDGTSRSHPPAGATERTRHDYGLDLEIKTYNDDGETESEHVLVQLKATDRLRVRDHGRAIAVRLDWRDVAAWCRELMPVILVLYDASEDKAYWLHVQPYFRGRPRVRRREDEPRPCSCPRSRF